jgi:serine/threonine protein kinase
MTHTRIGRYEVEKQLGAGAMAVVFKAVDPVIGRTVAIKIIKFDSSIGAEQAEMRERLYREAQSAGNLNHPSIVTIYDIGEEGSTAYIAMEFVEGQTLQDWIAGNPVPPVQLTLAIVEQIASGLDFAAARGIIHRDIKPGNILLTQDGRAKIADFGIAKFSTSKLTQTGAIIGTPAYMSPEQAMGQTLDGRSDLFSLGVIFYEMLTGEKPFSGSNPTTIMYKILHEEPVPPQRINVTLHPAFDYIIGRMLAKDPNQRYQNCGELIQDLKNYPSLPPKKEPEPAPAPPRRSKSSGGARFLWTTLILVLVGGLGIAGYNFYLQYQRATDARSESSTKTAAVKTPPTLPSKAEPIRTANPPQDAIQTPAQPKEAQEAPDKTTAATQPKAQPQTPPAPKSPAAGAPSSSEVPKTAAPPKKEPPAPPKQPPVPEKPAQAEIRLEFAGETYPVALFDGARKLQDVTPGQSPVQVPAGDHRFRLVSEDAYLDQVSAARLKADQVITLTVPGLCSAFIEVPNDAYDGCEIQLDGKSLAAPYPAQIPKLAAGDHTIAFRWSSGKYAGKEFSSTFAGLVGRHYRIRGEPQTGQIAVQQIK